MSSLCNLCPRKCNIDRSITYGYCGVGDKLRIARVGLHYWEEPIISGDSGSGTIFFSGCNLGCSYCQNFNVSHRGQGQDYTVDELVDAIKRLEGEGANNINLVTANHYLDKIRMALDRYKPNIPICYNTSSYDSLDTLRAMNDYIDIYLADLKYCDSELSWELSRARDYPQVATSAIQYMRGKVDVIEKGIMKSGLIIRHLVLPSYIDNTRAVIAWLSANMPRSTIISLMSQYTPIAGVSVRLSRKIKPVEYKIAENLILDAGFENIYIQDNSSAKEEYIPPFNGDMNR